MWAWLGLALTVWSYTKKQDGDDGDVSASELRKMSLQLAEKRLTLAESNRWEELLRMYVRDVTEDALQAQTDGQHTSDDQRGHEACLRQSGLV